MSERDHERWRDELSAYLLGVLDPGEAAELERHIEGCAECRAELRWLRPAVGTLPESVERVEPSPRLRARLMEEVHADAEAARTAPAHAGAGDAADARPRRRAFSIGGLGLRPVLGLAAVLLIAVAIAGYAIGTDGSDRGADVTTVAAGQAPGVTAKVVREGDVGTLHLANVHQLPRDKVLEAWVRREGRIQPVPALFVPDREGRASTRIADLSGVDLVMVTTEPRGGTDYPTSAPIAKVPMRQ
jgi:anti-sigma-K factor RskA